MKNTAFSVIVVAALCLSKATQAEGYVDLLVGQASSKYSQQVLVSNNNFLYNSSLQTNSVTQNNLAAGFGLGFFTNEYIGADITYKHFGNTSAYGSSFLFRVKPIPELQFIAKLGGAYLSTSSSALIGSSNGFALTSGVGAKYALYKNMDLTVDYTHFSTAGFMNSANTYMGGMSYRF
ncbi:opacity protein-like surface antigen [Polynucleobacter sphagniphilus]|jgi:opacity protein-like surface antigen|uniref:hypothetical protein n=1 Tax=Polynucleobacter TaxID=44013 RepID=UPI0008F8D341|nr:MULTISPECIES: hypothetical protein [Polynucleobacter]MDH6302524.1 opacity protein-like surface antigen [Polynucleobacter sphagniphilus]OIM98999.1 hypothetical protein A9236_09465 [Polynucleobacter sp. QLW-P1DATA-2]OIN02201.1 hypothetical protein A9235_00365 [Polynucleobacter sp. MWH-Tro8-2-5-gr]